MALLRSRLARRLFQIALPLALCLIFLFPATSEAHAILLRSDPARDSVLSVAPSQVRMWFSEDLNPTFSTAYVVNAANSAAAVANNVKTHVDTGNAHVSSNDPKEMDVSLQPNLPPAVYVVLWRTQSATDGHILRGSFIFKVARPDGTVPGFNGPLPGQDVAGGGNASSGQLDGPTVFSLLMITLVEIGVVFWVGAQLWLTFVLQLTETDDQEQQAIYQRIEQRFERRFSLPVLLILLLANVGVLVGQALTLTGGQLGQALSPTILGGLASNGHFGTYWILRQIVIGLAIVIAAYTLLSRQRPGFINRSIPWANLVLGLALLIAITLSGHAAAVRGDIVTYSVLLDWLHLLAASLWVGGMMYIAVVYLPILRQSPLLERTRSLITTLPRYSPLAIAGVIIMAVSGPFNATVHMNSWQQLLTTAYGRTLIVKILLVGGLILTSAIHVGLFRPRLAKDYKKYVTATDVTQRRVTEEPQGQQHSENFTAQQVKALEGRVTSQTRRLMDVLSWEPLLGVAVLLCAGLLTVFAGTLQPTIPSQPQQPTTQPKPFTGTAKTTDKKFTVTVNITPNRFGRNVFTVSVLDSKGALVPDTKVGVSIYTRMLDMDMGTDSINLQPDGKGHFSGSGDLSMGGNWELRIQLRTLDNTLHETKVDFYAPF